MGHEQIKVGRLYIPPRDKRIEVKSKPVLGGAHNAQFLNAFSIGFLRYNDAIKELSKFKIPL